MAVRKIMTACGSGIGSSLMVRMNVQKILTAMGRDDIEVFNSTTSDAQPGAADVFVVGKDLESFVSGLNNVITLDNIVSRPELEEKLKALFDELGEEYNK
ncbi:PTS sugar transporter subunit IIB [uncultured Helcococcus sp.]|uniref:PTS sugar transporter subunit IIB n=1 Tax=uncultured Helcococcus sp. TaxID=1072508 RepID=UPI00288B53F9|nr:PTS sugar transporter subunit IIB [uncultured Helcococcus sp.]